MTMQAAAVNAVHAPGLRFTAGSSLVAPATLLVLVFLLLPLLLILRYSFDAHDPMKLMKDIWTLETYARIFEDPHYRGVLARTGLIAAVTTVATLALAVPVAYYVSRSRSERLRNTMMLLMILPMVLGNGVRSAAWMLLLGGKGILNSVIVALGAAPLDLLYTQSAVVIALVAVLLPFVVIMLVNVFDAIPVSLEEAAQCLGCSQLGAFRRAALPLAVPGLVSAGSVGFGLAMNAYATPVLIGGPTVRMMGPLVYEEITRMNNWPAGAVLAVVLMATTIGLIVASSALATRGRR